MSIIEDAAEIRQAAKIIEEMEIKYEDKLVAFGQAVRQRHPAEPYHRHLFFIPYLARSNYGYTLSPDQCDEENITFHDGDGDSYYLPILWLEDPEAWHTQAAQKEAEYQAKEKERKVRTRTQKIAELQAQIKDLETQP